MNMGSYSSNPGGTIRVMEAKTTAPPAKVIPQSKRGQSTRSSLLRAARVVLERDGYIDSKISEIAREAGAANGSFYTYFTDKRDIFMAMIEETEHAMLYPDLEEIESSHDPVERIRASNRVYLTMYRDAAKLMKLLEQVATLDEDFMANRRRRGEAFIRRNSKGILRLQANGTADPELDAELISMALSSMVSRVAYAAFVVRSTTDDIDDLVETVTSIWVKVLGLDAPR